jgi:Flp pilus assembly protein TadD
MFRALGDYSRLMIFPSNLHMERTVLNAAAFHSEKVRRNWISLEYLSILGLIALGAFAGLSSRRGTAQRVRIFGAVWFLLGFLPVSNLLDLNATVAEHWLYLPSAGFLIFLAGCALDFSVQWRRASVAFACAAILGLGARSFARSSDWTSNETFAQQTIASGGGSVRIAMLLAQVYSARGEHAKAEGLLRRGLQIYPDYPIARNNLADAVFHQGKEKEAETLFASATDAARENKKEYPRTWIAALNFAHVLHKKHDDAGAIAVLEKARPDYPYAWELISSESELLRGTNNLDAAIALVRPFAKNHWWHYGAWLALGRASAEKGDIEAADFALRRASALDVHETAALNLIALMRIRQNRLDDAVRAQRRAVAREPDQPRQYLLLSNILDKMGRDDESRAALAEATRLRTFAEDLKIAN